MILSDAAGQLIAVRGAPVIFVDTCSILDFVRGPRDKFGPNHASAGVALVEKFERGALTLIIAEQVSTELTANLADQVLLGRRAVDKANAGVADLNRIVSAYGEPLPAHTDVLGKEYADRSLAIVNRLRASSTIARATDEAKLKAMGRVISITAPAARGKDSLQDCMVLETYYEVLHEARQAGFAGEAHFLSANVAEFMDERQRDLHPTLAPEFMALQLRYWNNFAELRFKPSLRDL